MENDSQPVDINGKKYHRKGVAENRASETVFEGPGCSPIFSDQYFVKLQTM